jgi:uncharacterized coiled-coil protein SlyX
LTERSKELEERVRTLEQWRAEHDAWAEEKSDGLADSVIEHKETLEGLEARVRLLELWKAETSGAAPLKETLTTNLVIDVEDAKKTVNQMEKRLSKLQFRMFMFMGTATGLAVFLAKIFGDVVGGLLLKRLLGISSMPPTVP